MSQLQRQNELKLDVLHSLARSQRALAHMLETLSSEAITSETTARQLMKLIESLSSYQQAIASKLNVLTIRQVKKGRSGKVWLANDNLLKPYTRSSSPACVKPPPKP